jgi:hypothetical protein
MPPGGCRSADPVDWVAGAAVSDDSHRSRECPVLWYGEIAPLMQIAELLRDRILPSAGGSMDQPVHLMRRLMMINMEFYTWQATRNR